MSAAAGLTQWQSQLSGPCGHSRHCRKARLSKLVRQSSLDAKAALWRCFSPLKADKLVESEGMLLSLVVTILPRAEAMLLRAEGMHEGCHYIAEGCQHPTKPSCHRATM